MIARPYRAEQRVVFPKRIRPRWLLAGTPTTAQRVKDESMITDMSYIAPHVRVALRQAANDTLCMSLIFNTQNKYIPTQQSPPTFDNALRLVKYRPLFCATHKAWQRGEFPKMNTSRRETASFLAETSVICKVLERSLLFTQGDTR